MQKLLLCLFVAYCSSAIAQYLPLKDFQDASVNSGGWEEIVVQSTPGTYNWSASNQGTGNNYYGKASGWNGSAAETTELWLVSPAFDLSGATSPVLNFLNARNFNGPDLQLKISTSYNGNGTAVPGEWSDLTSLATWSQGSFAFVSSGDISLSQYTGENNLHIAFVYTSNPTDGARTWEVDNIEVSEYSAPIVLSISDVQATTTGDLSDLEGSSVSISGSVTAVKNGAGFWIQDGISPNSGIFVFDSGNNAVEIGDSVMVEGTVVEYAPGTSAEKTTQIASVSSFNNLGPGTFYSPIILTSAAANSEQYESMLIRINTAECMSLPDNFNEWVINDNTGDLKVDDYIYPVSPLPTIGNDYTVTGVLSHNFQAYKILPRNSSDIEGEFTPPTVLPISQVQATSSGDLSDLEDTMVTVGGRVSAVKADAGFWIQDGTGAFSGIFVYDAGQNIVLIGDSVILTGTVVEYAPAQSSIEKTTQIASLVSFENVGPFSPHPLIIVTSNSANQESYESMLVSVTGATCNAGLDGFNEWVINDGTGDIRVDDYIYLPTPAPVVGNVYNVTGVVSHNFAAYKILPRDAQDITAGTVSVQNAAQVGSLNIFPNPSDGKVFIARSKNTSVSIYDAFGRMILYTNDQEVNLYPGVYKVVCGNETSTIIIR